ncbi:MAG TPA: hypothetical protein PKZ26_07855 [Anaerolineaceae bacterium]|nr:hypothetical protein [Chloroflexota bacterium]HNW14105.1 hypothetical protein [Anaerolineaceae bacterium]HOE02728.1 hypothetical protein [Anaerolineaceae bacterium]HPD63642.1 hypothetical protein [Anaerolineaceae bacterium]HQK05824.1 hypothetical protein [Anaerolineaceae bacterium]
MITVILHMLNEDPVVGELEKLPAATDTLVYIHHPRRRDGKILPYIESNVTVAAWPITRLSFFEILPDEQEDDLDNDVRE